MSDPAPETNDVHLQILSPEEVLVDARVQWVQVPLVDGLIGIWPGHAPLIGALDGGVVEYALPDEVRELPVVSGVLRVTSERCVVLVSRLGGEEEPGIPAADRDRLFDDLTDALEESITDEEFDALQGE